MPKPTIGQSTWGQTLNDHLDSMAADTAALSAVIMAPAPSGASDTATLQALLDGLPANGTLRLRKGETYLANLSVPAGRTLDGDGATVKPATNATPYIVTSGGAGARVRNIRFDFTADDGLAGGDSAVLIGHAQVEVRGCTFLGNGYRYGILVQHATGGSCDEAVIRENAFDTTSYGVLKQGGNGTTFHRGDISNNRFTTIMRGDAIELNIGADVGFRVCDNIIDGVTANGVTNAGFGIGIAGGSYGGAESTLSRDFTVSGNQVSNVEAQAIHIEACARGQVAHNVAWQESTLVGTGTGVAVYGCTDTTVEGNHVRDFSFGIRDDLGSSAGSFVASTNNTVTRSNRVEGCTTGIYSGVAGENKRADVVGNLVESCTTGIKHEGAAAVYLLDNRVVETTTPFYIDMAPGSKAAVAAAYTRLLHVDGNRTYFKGLPQAKSNNIVSTSGASVFEGDNTFTLGSAPTDKRDYHTPGDIILDGTTPYVCTAAGWTKATAASHFVTATVGNDYLVDVTGDPSAVFKVGQRVTVAGAGAGGSTLTGTIRQMYVGGGSEYRIQLDTTVGTTVGSTTINLEQTSSLSAIGGLSRQTVPAGAMVAVSGSAASFGTVGGGRWSAVLYDSTLDESAAAAFEVPEGWTTVNIHIDWVNAGAGAGDVVWAYVLDSAPTGNTVAATGTTADTTAAAGAQDILQRATLASGASVTPGRLTQVRILRRGSNGSDTLANDAGLLRVVIEKAS